MGGEAPLGMNFIGGCEGFLVNLVDLAVFFGQLTDDATDLALKTPSGFVAVRVEDLDAGVADGIVAGGDHATCSRAKGQHGMMQGRRCALVNVNHMTARQTQAEGQGSDQRTVIGSCIPTDDDGVSLSRQFRLSVGKRFTNQPHKGRREGSVVFQERNRLVFVHFVKRRFAANTVGAKEGRHAHSSSV